MLGPGWVSNLDAAWEESRDTRLLSVLAECAHVVAYDALGTDALDVTPI